MTTHIHLKDADRLAINGVGYRPIETTGDGHLLERLDQPGRIDALTHDQFAELLAANAIHFEQGAAQ